MSSEEYLKNKNSIQKKNTHYKMYKSGKQWLLDGVLFRC